MRIGIIHDTTYRYEQPARALIQILRLRPRDHDGQHVLRWRLDPRVEGRMTAHADHFGNAVHTFSADEPTRELTIQVQGEVETNDTAGIVRHAVERLPDVCYLRETELTLADEAIRDFARRIAGPPGDELATLHRLLAAVQETIAFDVEPTHSATRAAEAFAMKRGVCQDLTHIFIAAARQLGIPSRYVSGYFLRGDGVVEQVAGHAWAEAKIPNVGWVGFDPTNGLCTTDSHVRVAIGLDYLGAAPVRGSRRGGGNETLQVRIRIEKTTPTSQTQTQSWADRLVP